MFKNKRIIYNYECEPHEILRYDELQKKDNIEFIPYIYKSHNLKDSNLSINKEILRSIIIKKLIEIFIKEIRNIRGIKNFGKIFKHNKLTEYVERWCWLQYENLTLEDVVIPYCSNEKYNFDEFIEDFNYTLNTSFDHNNIYVIKLIDIVKNFLKEEFLKFSKEEVSNKLLEIEIDRNKDEVKLFCNYENKEYSIIINNNVYLRLKLKLHNNNIDNDINKYIFCLVYRYAYIDAENQQLAIHKKIKEMFKKVGVNFELYGSAINVLSDHYCSLFYDLEKYFGSKGNFFDIEIKSGIYWCNPPYIDNLMTKTAKKLIDVMNKNKNVAFIITIPIWDKETQKHKLSEIKRNFNQNIENKKFIDYQIYYLLKPYIKDELIIPKNKIPYFNYRYYKPINARDTYMLIIYKDNNSIYKYLHKVFDEILILEKSNYFELNN
jgi:hypothetical protein